LLLLFDRTAKKFKPESLMNKQKNARTAKKNGNKKPILPAVAAERTDLVDMWIGKRGVWVCLVALVGIGAYVFFDFLTFQRLYVFKGIASDSYNAVLPSLIHLSRYIRTDGIPRWSFYVGMGQNVFPEGLNSPFTTLLILLSPDKIPFAIAWMELLKIVLAGLCFYGYLRTIPLTRFTSLTGSLFYAFSGFIIVGSGWFSYSATGVYVAFLLFAFEKLYRNRDGRWFPVAVALLSSSVFSLYTYGLFLLLYATVRFFDDHKGSIGEYFRVITNMALLGALGIAIGFICFFSEALHMVQSPRVSGHVGYFQSLRQVPLFGLENWSITRASWGIPLLHLKTAVLRLFSSDLMGTANYFRGWYNYLEAPLFYCGLLTLLLVPSLFASLDKRRKWLYGAFIAFWVVLVVFPWFRYAYNLFAGDYYKTGLSLIGVLVLLYTGMRALDFYDRTPKPNPWYLPGSWFGLLVLLFGINFPGRPGIIQDDLRSGAALYLTIYAALLFLMRLPALRNAAKIAILAVAIVEVASFSHVSVNQRMTMSGSELREERTGYNDFSVDAAAWLKQTDPGFYRLTKDYFSGTAIHTSFNDAEIQGFFGTRSYSSFNQLSYVKFLQEAGVISDTEETATRWIIGLRNRPVLQSLCTVKYNLTKSPRTGFYRIGFDSIAQFGDVTVERNQYFLPLGICYGAYVTMGNYQTLSTIMRREILLHACVLEDTISSVTDGLRRMDTQDTTGLYFTGLGTGNAEAIARFQEDIKNLKRDTLALAVHRENHLKGVVHLSERKMMYFAIPFDKGWHARVDGVPAKLYKVNVGFTGLPLPAGEHRVELSFDPPYWQLGLGVTIAGLLIYAVLLVMYRRREISEKGE
jgi:hypothetical protein